MERYGYEMKEEGRQEGREEGLVKALTSMYSKQLITIEDVMSELGCSQEEAIKLMTGNKTQTIQRPQKKI